MKNRTLAVIAFALVVIALNLTYQNFVGQKTAEQPKTQEEIVQVVGRVTMPFDGLGAEVGFLVTNGEELRIVRYDEGSMAAQKGWEPKYLAMMTSSKGETSVSPLIVDQFR